MAAEWESLVFRLLPVFFVGIMVLLVVELIFLSITLGNWGNAYSSRTGQYEKRTPRQQWWFEFGEVGAKYTVFTIGGLVVFLLVCVVIDLVGLVTGPVPWYEKLRN